MLQNAYFLAKIGADPAENERHFAEILPKIGNYPTGPRPPTEPAEGSPPLASLNARRRPGGRGRGGLPGALAGRPEPALRAVFSHVITCFLHAVWHVLHERMGCTTLHARPAQFGKQ